MVDAILTAGLCALLWFVVLCCVYAWRGYRNATQYNRRLEEQQAWLNMAVTLRREGRWSEFCEKSEVETT